MSHWHHMMIIGTEFWIGCERLRLLRKVSHWQLIQKSAPSTILWRQCDIQMVLIIGWWGSNLWTIFELSDHSGFWRAQHSCHVDMQRIRECLAWPSERVVKGKLVHMHADKIYEWPAAVLASTPKRHGCSKKMPNKQRAHANFWPKEA